MRAYVWITLVPFVIFSSFHVLNYVNTHLLPIVGLDGNNPISKHITAFVNKIILLQFKLLVGLNYSRLFGYSLE